MRDYIKTMPELYRSFCPHALGSWHFSMIDDSRCTRAFSTTAPVHREVTVSMVVSFKFMISSLRNTLKIPITGVLKKVASYAKDLRCNVILCFLGIHYQPIETVTSVKTLYTPEKTLKVLGRKQQAGNVRKD